MYWESGKEKHLVLELSDVCERSRGKSVHDTVMADFKLEVKAPIHFANFVIYQGKVMKDRCLERERMNKDIVLTIDDLRTDAQNKQVRELSICDFNVYREILERASSIVFVIPFKQRI